MPAGVTADVPAVHSRAEAAIYREINRVRRSKGIPRLRVSRRLARLADRHSKAILRHDKLSHDVGTPFARRARAVGTMAENLAWVQRGTKARTVVRMWLRSPGHRVILLDREMRRIGIARIPGKLGKRRGLAITADFSD